MGTYLLRRLLTALPVLIGISLVLFTILALAPGDPFGELATNPNVPPEVRANLRKQFGLDDPVAVRYVRWFSSMLQGDWGFSFVSRVNVDVLIQQRLVTTLFVLGSAQILALLIAIPVGVLSARRPYSFFDQVATTLAFIGFSLPTFFTGLLFILLFSIYLDWLPFIYRADIQETGLRWLWENLKQGIMPITVLGLLFRAPSSLASCGRRCSTSSSSTTSAPRARRGSRSDSTLVKHVVRNALIPVVTLLAIQVPQIFTGAVVTEQIFRVPGIGSLLISSILSNDTPVIMGVTFVYAGAGGDLRADRGHPLRLARPADLVPLRGTMAANGTRLGGAGAGSWCGPPPGDPTRSGPRPRGGSDGTGSPWSGWSCSRPWSWPSSSDPSSTGSPSTRSTSGRS